MQTSAEFQPEGDAAWALRQIRDIMVDYMRALSKSYSIMNQVEKMQLCRLTLFEATRRPVQNE